MNALLSALETWQLPVVLTRENRCERVVKVAAAVMHKLSGASLDLPQAELLEQAYHRLASAYESGRLGEMPQRIVRYSPWAIFYSKDGGEPLVRRRGFVSAYLKWFAQWAKTRAALNLAHVYLYHYQPGSPVMEALRIQALALLRSSKSPKAEGLVERSAAWGLLEKDGPIHFARAVMERRAPRQEVEDQAGLTGTLAGQGFAEHGFLALCDSISAALLDGTLKGGDLDVLLTLAVRQDGRALQFGPRTSGKLAESLLMPFAGRDPEIELRERIKGFLLERFGDPRLQPEAWNQVDDAAQAVLRRWLVAGTLEDFFRLLDKSSKTDRDADRHWRYRRAFWSTYLEHGAIDEAWVALGPGVRMEARKFLSELAGSYAQLSGAQARHAVLIMQIGGLTIAEWSHSGKCRIWTASNRAAPKMYRGAYTRGDFIRSPSFEKSHYGSENGGWQVIIRDYLADHTGIKFHLRELMPK